MRIRIVSIVLLVAGMIALAWWYLNRDTKPIDPTPPPPVTPINLAPGYFEDVTSASGVDFTYRNGAEAGHTTIFESIGGGVALIDYDGDGLLDVFLTGGGAFEGADKKDIRGLPCKLYRNLGAFKFKDVTMDVGLDRLAGGKPWFYSHGTAVADYDNDGWPDLLVTGWGRLALFHNEPVDRRDAAKGRKFVDVTAGTGLMDGITWATSAGFGDLDGDGFPELYVCQYVNWSWQNHPRCNDLQNKLRRDVCPPEQFDALPHLLYRNNGGRSFSLISAEAGLRYPRADDAYAKLTHLSPTARESLRKRDRAKNFGKGLGVLMADVNDDGKIDICVANDTSGNFLYLNRGNNRFEEAGMESGIAVDDDGNAPGSMGIDVADYNGTGRLSIFVANFQNQLHGLYRNRGQGQFAFASRSAGLSELGRNYVGFGTGFLDFDLDGNEDLFLSNGHVVYYPPPPAELKQRPLLLRNERKPSDKPHEVRFADVSSKAGPYFQRSHLGRGAALGDLDNDGRADLVLTPTNEPAAILKNRHTTDHHWLGIELVGKPYRDAVGAWLELEVGGQKLVRTIKGGGSYLSACDRRVILGLSDYDKIGKLTVRWPSGQTQTWDNLAIDRYWQLQQGEK